MKRLLVALGLIAILVGGFLLWKRGHGSEPKAAEAKPEEAKTDEAASRVTHDDQGRTVVKMDDEAQGKMGLLVEKPNVCQQSNELKGYGKVLDPTPLAALLTELATAQAAASASSNELARTRLLASQQNTSERLVQTAEANAIRDQLAVQSAKERLILTWGNAIAEQTNLPAFIQPLTELKAVLVRIDLPVGETLAVPPKRARITNLAGKATEAEFLSTASNVDPQTLGRGAIFRIQPNELHLLSGEAVIGYIQLPGEPESGVAIPEKSVIEAEGRSWVYVMTSGGDAFVRMEIPQDHPIEGGWFVAHGLSTNDYIVVTGAQTLHSEELKSTLKAD